MADEALKKKIHDVLSQSYFKDQGDLVDVSNGSGDGIEVLVVSRKFDGQRLQAREDLICDALVAALTPEEWGRITLTVAASPEEIKAYG